MWIRDKAQLLKQDAGFLLFKISGSEFRIGSPSLDEETLAAVQLDMAKSKGYLEYGSGGSTCMAAGIVAGPITTVESDLAFLSAVRLAIPQELRPKVNFIHADIGPTLAWGRPMLPWTRNKWPVYPDAPWKQMSYIPDLVVIDGRFRLACALTSILSVPKDWEGVIYIDDYVGRSHYHSIEKYALDPKQVGRALRFSIGEFDRDAALADLKEATLVWQ